MERTIAQPQHVPIAVGLVSASPRHRSDVAGRPGAYLWPGVDRLLPGTANEVMLAVGVIEVLAGVLVAVRPRIGGYVVAAWLAGIIVNLLLVGDFTTSPCASAGIRPSCRVRKGRRGAVPVR